MNFINYRIVAKALNHELETQNLGYQAELGNENIINTKMLPPVGAHRRAPSDMGPHRERCKPVSSEVHPQTCAPKNTNLTQKPRKLSPNMLQLRDFQ